jgi:hypothetical protein
MANCMNAPLAGHHGEKQQNHPIYGVIASRKGFRPVFIKEKRGHIYQMTLWHGRCLQEL